MEVFRRVLEGSLDAVASVPVFAITRPGKLTTVAGLGSASNERVVLESARFYIEYKQMEHRVRLDVPTLADPVVRDLLQESELFSRSFSGSGFGFLSPLDFLQIISLTTEILSHLFLIISLTNAPSLCGVLILTVLSTLLPTLLSLYNVPANPPDARTTSKEARAADRLEKMRNLAYSDSYRPEIALFGLGEWILKSWSSARKVILEAEATQPYHSSYLAQSNLTELVYAVQNVCLLTFFVTRLASRMANIRAHIDTFAIPPQEFFHLSRFNHSLPNFDSINHLCLKGSGYHNTDGISRHLLNVGFLRKLGTQATATTSSARRY